MSVREVDLENLGLPVGPIFRFWFAGQHSGEDILSLREGQEADVTLKLWAARSLVSNFALFDTVLTFVTAFRSKLIAR